MAPECEHINPYGEEDLRGKADQVEQMFDSIAPAYDLMNKLMTLGIDHRWRNKAVKMLCANGREPRYILDVATGTADLAILMARRIDGVVGLTGIDLSEEMLAVGRKKVNAAGLADIITLSRADCLQLPFPDNTFDSVTVAYGVRNFENLEQGYAEMHRVLKPGGRLAVLELSTPRNPLVKPLYRLYTQKIIPWVGRRVSRDLSAYTYLPASIAAVPQGQEMASLMRSAGFASVEVKPMTFGVCTLYLADK